MKMANKTAISYVICKHSVHYRICSNIPPKKNQNWKIIDALRPTTTSSTSASSTPQPSHRWLPYLAIAAKPSQYSFNLPDSSICMADAAPLRCTYTSWFNVASTSQSQSYHLGTLFIALLFNTMNTLRCVASLAPLQYRPHIRLFTTLTFSFMYPIFNCKNTFYIRGVST